MFMHAQECDTVFDGTTFNCLSDQIRSDVFRPVPGANENNCYTDPEQIISHQQVCRGFELKMSSLSYAIFTVLQKHIVNISLT